MSEVVSWVVEVTVKPGRLETFKELVAEMVEGTKAEKGALTYEFFLSEDGSKCHVYERYADSAAALEHMGGFGARWGARFVENVEIDRFTTYGVPSAEARAGLETMRSTFLAPLDGFAR